MKIFRFLILCNRKRWDCKNGNQIGLAAKASPQIVKALIIVTSQNSYCIFKLKLLTLDKRRRCKPCKFLCDFFLLLLPKSNIFDWSQLVFGSLASSASWTYCLIAQSVRESERNLVVVGSNPTQTTFSGYFKESLSGEYHVYQFIPLHTCDHLKKISIKINVTTGEDNNRNEIWY